MSRLPRRLRADLAALAGRRLGDAADLLGSAAVRCHVAAHRYRSTPSAPPDEGGTVHRLETRPEVRAARRAHPSAFPAKPVETREPRGDLL